MVDAPVSAGIATADRSATVGKLLARADAALYRAKALGRNRVEVAEIADQATDSTRLVRVA